MGEYASGEKAVLMDRVADVIDNLAADAALQDVLFAVQAAAGYIPLPSIALIADKAGVERAAIYRVIELSPSLHLTAPGQHKLYICTASNCSSLGGAALVDAARELLSIDFYQTTADNRVRFEPFHCLGNCGFGPNVMIDDAIHGPVTVAELQVLLEQLSRS